MKSHLRANLFLFGITAGLCCVLYPAVLYVVGRGLFREAAAGSLVADGGQLRGSHLIAQPFTAEEYFWPRPSAASYDGTASGGSNWAASNPKLRDRVVQALAPILQYKKGSRFSTGADATRAVQRDVEAWAAGRPKPADFEQWLSDPANKDKVADLEPVVADMVTASGSGLDPHITLRNALSVYQLDRVAIKRTPTSGDRAKVREEIAKAVRALSFTPLAGTVGETLVNVLELNRKLDQQFPRVPS